MGAAAVIMGGAQGALSLNQANEQAKAIQAQGRYQNQVAETNAMYAELQAKDAIARGEKAAIAAKKRGRQVIGAQRAALAAQGVELDSGSALEIQEDTAEQANNDALTIRNNAWREAWGFKAESAAQTAQGKFASITARANSANTLMTGGIQAVNYGAQGFQNAGYFNGGSTSAPAAKGKR